MNDLSALRLDAAVTITGPLGSPPAEMSEAARTKWKIMAREWGPVLRSCDRDLLRLYCETWVEMTAAQKNVDESGVMVLTPNGSVVKSPWMAKVEQCRSELRAIIKEMRRFAG